MIWWPSLTAFLCNMAPALWRVLKIFKYSTLWLVLQRVIPTKHSKNAQILAAKQLIDVPLWWPLSVMMRAAFVLISSLCVWQLLWQAFWSCLPFVALCDPPIRVLEWNQSGFVLLPTDNAPLWWQWPSSFFFDYTQFFFSRFHPFARLETSLRVGEKSLRVGSLIRSLNRFFESTNNQRSVTASDFYFIVVITTAPRWARQIFIAAMNYEKGSQRIVETRVTDSPTPPRWGHISQLSE